MRLVEHFEATARQHPEWVFLEAVTLDDGACMPLRYDEAEREANQRAHLLADLGLETGQRIGILQGNSADWVLWYLAALKSGVVAVALNPDAPLLELESLIVDASVRLLLASDKTAALAQALADKVDAVQGAFSPSGRDGTMSARARMADMPTGAPARADDDGNPCVAVIFSSGTTGARPKAVMVTDQQLVVGVGAYGVAAGLTAQDRIFVCTPIFHSCTLSWGITLTILAGATLVMTDRFSASKTWGAVQRTKASVFWTMGSILHILMQSPLSAVETEAAANLRVMFAAGLGRQVREALVRWPDTQLIDGYGLSESPGTIALDDSFDRDEAFPCIGRPVSSVAMTLIDPETGRICGLRETGEIVIDLTHGFAGYLNNPEATDEAIRAGVFHTGDLAYRDEEGRFYFVSRIKDIIRRGGQNISAGEVEQVALQHPAIAEAAAVPKPDRVLGETVALYCVLQGDGEGDGSEALTLADLRAFCDGKLAKYRWPETLIVMKADEIPRTSTGKIAKFQLKTALLQEA